MKTIKYEKPEIKSVETALEAVQDPMTKPGFFLESFGNYGTAAAYESDE